MRLREGGGRLRKMGKEKKEKGRREGRRKEREEKGEEGEKGEKARCEGEVEMGWGGMELSRGRSE